jgi:DNA-3-methyladenine glycosylase II
VAGRITISARSKTSKSTGPTTFHYGETELAHLRRVDPTLGRAIDRIGRIERAVIPDLFTALLHAAVCQQVSLQAATAIWTRVEERIRPLTPETVCATPPEELRGCGLSARKTEYLRGIGDAVLRGELDLAGLHDLPDETVIERLCSLRGVGRWTAEMLLIFSMERPDVVSWGDLAIRRGMAMLYGLESVDRREFERYRARYSPHGSVASLYLWAVSKERAQPFARP